MQTPATTETKPEPAKELDLKEQLALAQAMVKQSEEELAFRRGIVQCLSQLVKKEPIISKLEEPKEGK